MSKSLTQIGREMRAKADADGTAYRGLGSGLHLHLSQSGGIYTLLLWRAETLPSQQEIETVCRDWNLPLDVQISAPAQLVWVKGRALDDSICRVLTWGGPRVVEDDPGTSEEELAPDRPPLRARPNPRAVQASGIVGERWEPQPVAPPQTDPDDPWVRLIRWQLARAQERNDAPRIQLYQSILKDVPAEAA